MLCKGLVVLSEGEIDRDILSSSQLYIYFKSPNSYGCCCSLAALILISHTQKLWIHPKKNKKNMHGRVKSVEREKEQRKTDEERQEDLRKVRMYHEVAGKILALKKQGLREAHVLPLTSHLLLLNPEFHMVWSYRREIIDAISAGAQDPQAELQELAKTELKLTLVRVYACCWCHWWLSVVWNWMFKASRCV